tara:strand:- start:188 stop:550 length:363 start_codon:yes stop_codon:yes gene_type:complete
MTTLEITNRLEYLRLELRAERISLDEIVELQSLSQYIDSNDVELLEAAGVPENDEIIEFSDGYQFKEISKNEASNLIGVCYGIDIAGENEALIERVEDLQNFDNFGIEIGFKKILVNVTF